MSGPLSVLKSKKKTVTTEAATWALPLGVPAAGETLQNWIYRTLRLAILDGRLEKGTRLPGTRALAQQQSIARGTVQAAYDQLLSEGYIDSKHGSGTRVAATLPDSRLHAGIVNEPEVELEKAETNSPPGLGRWIGKLDNLGAAFPICPVAGPPPLFYPHRCDVDAFPVDIWRRLHMRFLRKGKTEVFGDPGPAGLLSLRAAISAHLRVARAVAVPPEQIVIIGSVQQALDICLRLLAGPNDRVWMEDPGYPGARQLMLASGLQVTDVPVDADGIRVEDGIRAAPDASLAYVTPARQMPLGMPLTQERRSALLQWARDKGAYIFEDDYDSEYRFVDRPIPALRSNPDSESNVILAGTFSKLLFPSIRIAFVALPRQLVDRFVRAFSLTNRNANGLTQAVLAEFMTEGHFDRHIRRMRRLYALRADAFVDAANRHWKNLIEVPSPQAGLDVATRLIGIDEHTALARLAPGGFTAFPMSRYKGSIMREPGLVMGFAPFDELAIECGVQRIGELLRGSY
jgi:GntR family transcriptional regulator/MocR family aminotransferase